MDASWDLPNRSATGELVPDPKLCILDLGLILSLSRAHLSRVSPAHAAWCDVLGVDASRMLIGACDLIYVSEHVCPFHACHPQQRAKRSLCQLASKIPVLIPN